MELRDRLADAVERSPLDRPDPGPILARARRRTRRRRTGAVAAAAAVIALAVPVIGQLLPGLDRTPPLISETPDTPAPPPDDPTPTPDGPTPTPDGSETPDDIPTPGGPPAEPPPETDPPEDDPVVDTTGWQEVDNGRIALLVPPDWQVRRVVNHALQQPGAHMGGPCLYDLYRGDDFAPFTADDPSPIVVYDFPTDGGCRAIGIERPPPLPGIALFVGSNHPRPPTPVGTQTRIGTLDVITGTVDADLDIVGYWATDGTAGLYVSHPQDPVIQHILFTARPVTPTS